MVVGLALALLLELVGLTLAAIGFHETWTKYAEGRDFWAPEKRRARAIARRVENGFRWLFRRPRRIERRAASGTFGVTISAEASFVVGWGPLPDPTDSRAFAAAVHERLNRLHSMIQDDQHALADEQKAREKGEQELRSELAREIARVGAATHRVAVGGLRLQFLGWLFLLAGIFLGGLVTVVDRVTA